MLLGKSFVISGVFLIVFLCGKSEFVLWWIVVVYVIVCFGIHLQLILLDLKSFAVNNCITCIVCIYLSYIWHSLLYFSYNYMALFCIFYTGFASGWRGSIWCYCGNPYVISCIFYETFVWHTLLCSWNIVVVHDIIYIGCLFIIIIVYTWRRSW